MSPTTQARRAGQHRTTSCACHGLFASPSKAGSAPLIELGPFCRPQGFYKFGFSPARSWRENSTSHSGCFLQGLEADTILFNPVGEVPAVGKYLPPVWLWATTFLGSIELETQKLPKEERQACLCENPRDWGAIWDHMLRPQVAAGLENGRVDKGTTAISGGFSAPRKP